MCKIDMKIENVSAKVIPTVKFKHIAIGSRLSTFSSLVWQKQTENAAIIVSGDPFFVGRIGGFQPDDEVHLINGQ